MAFKKTSQKSQKAVQQPKKALEIIELSSSSSSVDLSDDEAPPSAQTPVREKNVKGRSETAEDILSSPRSAKLPVRAKNATGSSRHRHVSIEIPLPTSSTRSMDDEVPDSDEGNETEVFKTPMLARKHITFDSSDGEEFVTPREAPLRNPLEKALSGLSKATTVAGAEEEEEEEESDDDAAPEAVSTHAAAVKSTNAAQVAAKAVERQATELKRKRQERNANFREQAEERKSAQKQEASAEGDEAPAPPLRSAEKRKRGLPNLLPLELLESDDEDDAPQQLGSDTKSKKRKIGAKAEKKLAYGPRLPRDERVGSTVFRVVADRRDAKLAPKVKKQTVDLKEQLLRRTRAVSQCKGGFFVKNR
ncbi:hypothetical protein B0H63DRAFT_526393 [Podospora didyma]|uniref:Uncharacterized protein n=1 Tax=Podospora didyma TaxID=330526 RepID=A0AAE0N8X4_9PEZI|nr:hypothetical protein B0H63DRAFT_526393 [Podospora didyma]